MANQRDTAAWNQDVDSRIKLIDESLDKNESLRAKLPGFKSLLDDYLAPNVDVSNQDFHRRLLQVFRDSAVDNTYQDLLSHFNQDEQARISKFVDGEGLDDVCHGFDMGPSLGVREHHEVMAKADAVFVSSKGPEHVRGLSMGSLLERDNVFHQFVQKLAEFFGDEEKDSVLVYRDAQFQNWGLIVDYTPTFTCIPSSVKGIQRIVKYAKKHNMGVRCSGFRHSWSPIFGRDGQILISLLGLHEATVIPNTTALPFPESDPTELESIEIVPGNPRVKGNGLVRVGVSTTNERLRRWCIQNRKYTLPLNVIMVEMTIGGTNGPICHGAGRNHQTLSDLVRKVEYVDCNGERRVVEDPNHLRAAAGCFGLMGIITHITFEMAPMTYALLSPTKIPVVRAVPPPLEWKDEEVPPALRVQGLTEKEKAEDVANFEKQCMSDYYAEWFWFPYSDYAWVNCWNDTTEPGDVEDYPSPPLIFFQFISQFTMNVIQNANILDDVIQDTGLSEAAVTLFSRAAMFAMPENKVKTYLTDGLHFQRGIQNIRVMDMEVEMPIPAKKGTTDIPDFTMVRRAWWDAILKCYAHSDTCPQRMPLEMRIMGDSGMIMAPQRGNTLGTCAIEVLTLHGVNDIWDPYAQEVLNKWMSYTDAEGKRLKTRPHWAKQWIHYNVDGQPWVKRMKDVDYKDEIVEFKETLAQIGKEHGWTLEDLKARFSNDLFDAVYFDDAGHKGVMGVVNGTVNGHA